MPIPGANQEKRLGKIRAELTDGMSYNNDPITDEETSLNEAEDSVYDIINQASIPSSPGSFPNADNPAQVSEWDNYDHSAIADVFGCTDSNANNFNPSANINQNCTYNAGCTDPIACNYDPDAYVADGSCAYAADLYPNGYQNCDGSCINDSDGDGVCDEVEISGCTNALSVNSTSALSTLIGGIITEGNVTIDIIGNFNPDATDDDGSCELLYMGCGDPYSNNYDNFQILVNSLDGGGFNDIVGLAQIFTEDNETYCDYSVNTPYPTDDPPFYNLASGMSEASGNYIYGSNTSPNKRMPVSGHFGKTSQLKLNSVNFGGGPGNNSSNQWATFNGNNFNSFIQYIDVIAYPNGASYWTTTAEANGAAYRMYSNGTFYHTNGINLYSMLDEHGGQIKVKVTAKRFMSSANPSVLNSSISPNPYSTGQPASGYDFNTNPNGSANYTNDDPYYFRQAYLEWDFDDWDFSANNGDGTTNFPFQDPPVQTFGCVDMLDQGDATDEEDFDCPQGPKVVFQKVIQRFKHITYTPPSGPSQIGGGGMP